MAARRSTESCILCAPDPCTCGQPAPKPRKLTAPAVPKPPPPVPQVKPAEPQFDPTAQATVQQRRATISGIAQRGPSQDILEERRALTVLCKSGLVCWEDIDRYRSSLDMTAPEIDALIWRQKRQTWTKKS